MSEDAPNAQQRTYWNEAAGPTWAQLQAPLDRQLAPLGRRAMAALAPQAGQRLLDIGCGSGETTLELAAAVGPAGQVTGVDISATLLAVAQARPDRPPNARFVEADAQTHAFPPASFDGAFSRFGVMFFADPIAAFRNIHAALKPGARLAFVCWRTPAENPIMTGPMAAAAPFLPPPAPPPEPGAPGPFAFADPERPRGILAAAGFRDVEVTPYELPVGGGDLEATLELAMRVGPLGGLLRENPYAREPATQAIREFLAQHQGSDGVKLGSATWIVSARA